MIFLRLMARRKIYITRILQAHALRRHGKPSSDGKFTQLSNPLWYCPKCKLPYRATIPYVKHLKKHLIAIVRFNGIKERGTDYDFSSEVLSNVI